LSRPDRPTSAFCVGVRPAVALRRPTHSDAERTCPADTTHTATPDATRRSCLCRVWCASVNWTCSLFKLSGSATVLRCRLRIQSSSHRRRCYSESGADYKCPDSTRLSKTTADTDGQRCRPTLWADTVGDTDKTVLSCLAGGVN